MKSTRKAFVFSLLSMLLCVSMLIGTTFAWFTDTATSSNNRIVAGNLDVDLVMHNGTKYVSIAGGSGDIFDTAAKATNEPKSLWEPGKTQVVYLGVQNKGNLAIKYNIILDVTDTDATDGVNLADVLDYAIIDGAEAGTTSSPSYADWAAVSAAAASTGVIGTLMGEANPARITAASNGTLDEIRNGTKDETDYFVLAVHMQETAGNEYQGKEIVIDLSVVATQKDAEPDSFGPDYDEQATLPAATSIGRTIITKFTQTTDTLEINKSGDIESATVPGTAAKAYYDTATSELTGDNKEVTLNLNVEKTNESTVAEETKVELEISMSAIIKDEKIAQADPVPVTSLEDYVTINYNLGTNKNVTAVKHNGDDMVHLGSKDATTTSAAGGWYYDSATGILTLKTKSFSPFEVTYNSSPFAQYLAISSPAGVDILPDGYPFGITKENVKTLIGSIEGENKVATFNSLIHGATYTGTGSGEEDQLILNNCRQYKAVSEESYLQDGGKYRYWHGDFVVKFSKDISAFTNENINIENINNTIILAGEYGEFGWLKIPSNVAIEANAEKRLIKDYMGGEITINYEELCKTVIEFNCGAIYVNDTYNANDPLTMTIEFRLYETYTAEEAMDRGLGYTNNAETGDYIVVDTYTYTFQ